VFWKNGQGLLVQGGKCGGRSEVRSNIWRDVLLADTLVRVWKYRSCNTIFKPSFDALIRLNEEAVQIQEDLWVLSCFPQLCWSLSRSIIIRKCFSSWR